MEKKITSFLFFAFFQAIWNLDGDKLIAKEHWDGKEAIIVHHVEDDDWTSVYDF